MARCLWELKQALRFSGCCSRRVLLPKCSCCSARSKASRFGWRSGVTSPGSLFSARSARQKATVDYAYVSNALTREPSPHRFFPRCPSCLHQIGESFPSSRAHALTTGRFWRRSRILRSGLTLLFRPTCALCCGRLCACACAHGTAFADNLADFAGRTLRGVVRPPTKSLDPEPTALSPGIASAGPGFGKLLARALSTPVNSFPTHGDLRAWDNVSESYR
jgi:hypothetical protein